MVGKCANVVFVVLLSVFIMACSEDGSSVEGQSDSGNASSPAAQAGLPSEWADYGKEGLEMSAEGVFVEALKAANAGDFDRANSLVDATMQAAFNQGSIEKYWLKVTKNGTVSEFTVGRVQPRDGKTKLRVTAVYEDGTKIHINQSLSKKDGKWLLVND